jgi:lipopolysaccharide export system permease protein
MTETSRRRSPLALLRALYGPFAQLTARSFFAGVALQVFTIMVLVEAVFLAERFPMVFRNVFQHNADPLDTTLLFLFNSTQVFDLALAIAVLMAVYWTTLRMRENRELLVLFAAGAGPFRLIVQALIIAVLAQMASLTVSGVLDPVSLYAQRAVLFNAEFRALRKGINTGQFYKFPNRVAYAPAKQKSKKPAERTRGLFIYEQLKPDTFRVFTADRARLDGPDLSGRIVLSLGGFTSHTFPDPLPAEGGKPAPPPCTDCSEQLGGNARVTLMALDVTQQMTTDQLLAFLPRGSKSEEVTLFEQFAERPSTHHSEDMRLLGGRLSRSFLCLLAPLMALASVCLTTRRSNYFTLPLACMGLMALNVTSEWFIKTIAPSGPLEALGAPAVLTAVFAALLLLGIVRAQGKLAQPQLARP